MTIGRPIVALTVAGAALAGAAGCGGGSSNGSSTPSVGVLLQRASTEIKARQLAAAERDLAAIVAQQPKNLYAHYDRGLVAQLEGHAAAALSEYQLVLAQQPTYIPALFNSAVLYAPTQPGQAMVLYRKIIALRRHAPTAYLNLGLLEFAQHNRDQAAADLQVALQQQPGLRLRLTAAQRHLVDSTSGSLKLHSATPSPMISSVGAG